MKISSRILLYGIASNDAGRVVVLSTPALRSMRGEGREGSARLSRHVDSRREER